MPRVLRTFFIENLGCPKNAVEGEGMAERLSRAGYRPAETAHAADVVVVNTCSFIRPAQEESIDRIFHYVNRRRPGQRVIAAGCLSERYGAALQRDIPELDGVLGTRRWFDIAELVGQVERGARPCWHGADAVVDPAFDRSAAGPTAYVKIAEGCNMSCTFCAIPSFKGPQRSKSPDDIVQEVRQLVAGGVREVILVSQNSSAYGQDFARGAGGESAPVLRGVTLARLLERISAEAPELPWLRVHYAYPGWVTDDLLQTMARLDQVVKYLDMPLQHTHPEILRAMRRPSDEAQVLSVLDRARELMPDVSLRTTFITGFPGETRGHHEHMLRFMERARFDHVGIFPFFQEEGTPSASYANQVPERTRQARKRRALETQQAISQERNLRFVGRALPVLVEGAADRLPGADRGGGQLVGRTFRDAPEVDGFVLFRGEAQRGDIVPVTISGAGPYDLFGEQVGVTKPVDGGTVQSMGTDRAVGSLDGDQAQRRIGLKRLPLLQPR